MDHWNECIVSILTLLENRVQHKERPVSSIQATNTSPSSWSGSCYLSPMPLQKRKRVHGSDLRERKALRASNNSMILRMSTPPTCSSSPKPSGLSRSLQRTYKEPKRRQFSQSPSASHLSSSCKRLLNQWIQQMATSTDPADRSQSLKSDLTNTMARLQGVLHPSMPSMPAFQQYLVALKHDLALFVSLSKEWSSIHATQPLSLMFPDWPLLEEYIYELMRYTMIHDHLIQPRPVLTRTGDLYEDLQSLQQFLEDQCVLHGIHLVNQGQQWQDMGLPVDQDCLHQAKQYFFSTCRDMVESVYNALTCDGYTEKMMDCIVLAFECLATTHELIGDSLALELLQLCLPWLAIYGQWSVQQMEMVTPRSRAHRSDMRISQLLDYMTRILNSCHRLFQPSTTYTLDPVPTVSFATSLVDMTFLVVTALGQHSSSQHQNYIKRSNIMRSSPFAVFYLEKSLFDFASSAIALYSLMKESNKLYEQKMMSLLHVMQEDQ